DVPAVALVADQFELVAAVADFHRQALFDQAQVFVELSAEIGEAACFKGLEGEVMMRGRCVQGAKKGLGQKTMGASIAPAKSGGKVAGISGRLFVVWDGRGHTGNDGAGAVVASLWGRLYAGRRRWVLRPRAGWRRPLAGANPAPQGHQPLAPAGLPPASVQQRAAQRVGQGVLDAHLGELTDQQRVVT